MEELVKFSGIKCDNCDYRDDSVIFEDYPSYINKECPQCKANLLTQEDYDECVKIIEIGSRVMAMTEEDIMENYIEQNPDFKLLMEYLGKNSDFTIQLIDDGTNN